MCNAQRIKPEASGVSFDLEGGGRGTGCRIMLGPTQLLHRVSEPVVVAAQPRSQASQLEWDATDRHSPSIQLQL